MRLPDLDMDALRAFVAVVDADGFTAAGERLGRTQSAVSVRIRKLEALLGGALFARTSRSLALTERGEILLGYARRILALNEETVRRLIEPEAEGLLRLGVVEYVVPERLPRLLARFARAYPRIRLEVRIGMTADLLAALDADELDLVIGKREAGDERGRLLWREPLHWVGARDFVLAPYAEIPLATLPAPCIYRRYAIEALQRAGRPFRIMLTSASHLGVQAAAKAGLAVTVCSRSAVPPDLRVLGAAEGLPPLPDGEIAVFGEDAAAVPRTRPLLAHLVEALSDAPRPALAA